MCTCGSGRKFKRCCGANVIEFPSAGDRAERVGAAEQGGPSGVWSQASQSQTDQPNAFANGYGESTVHNTDRVWNIEPETADLFSNLPPEARNHLQQLSYGLYIEQMAEMLSSKMMSLDNSVFNFFPQSVSNYISADKANFTLVHLGLAALTCVASDGGHTPTASGFLPSSLHNYVIKSQYAAAIGSQDEFHVRENMILVDRLLLWSGFIQKRNRFFRITNKGMNIVNETDRVTMWTEFVKSIFLKWNWSQGKQFEYREHMQATFVFLLYLLHQRAQSWVSLNDIFKSYVRALPHILIEPKCRRREPILSYKDEIFAYFYMHTLNQILKPMGLVRTKNAQTVAQVADKFKAQAYLEIYRQEQIQVTPCFRDAFVFKPEFRPLRPAPTSDFVSPPVH